MAERQYRPLSESEIAALESQGCRADSWTNVEVVPAFRPERVVGCTFSGRLRLGLFRGSIPLDGAPLATGVYDSRLHDVTVDDGAVVHSVGLLACYEIGPGAVVFRCGQLSSEPGSSFGAGCRIRVFNEGGGREIPMYDRLSAQVAYLLANYRHRPKTVRALEDMIAMRVRASRRPRGELAADCRVTHCGVFRNVSVGPAAVLEGVELLEQATIVSTPEAPTRVGPGVQGRRLIVQTGTIIDGQALLQDCFIGQGCRIGRQFSAEHSAFFANSEGFHGEACSILAGPYSVTHHKSSLLIGGLFSFFNAGSGTNQSNHMYKLGPIHQGILERGSKTGSSSYLLWPARVGAFTAVMGKHDTNFDTRLLPFSYIDVIEGRSVVSPALNLFTVGTWRDGAKWPVRDRRHEQDRIDRIHFDVFSPLTIGHLLQGLAEIGELYDKTPREQEYVTYQGIRIKRLFCRTARKHYEIALRIYLGDLLVERLEQKPNMARALLSPAEGTPGAGRWVDLLGLLAPQSEVERLCDDMESGNIPHLSELSQRLEWMHESYPRYRWAWAQEIFQLREGKLPEEMTAEELSRLIHDWQVASVKLDNMILNDAGKEFLGTTRIGFGIDGDAATREQDFATVRGRLDDNPFAQQLRNHSAEVTRRAETLLQQIATDTS